MKTLILGLLIVSATDIYAVLIPQTDSIPMSDGRKLAADIYIPSGMNSGPVILIQTPYNRQVMRFTGLPMGIGMNLNSSNYIFVITDWRGFYGSAKAAYFGSPERGLDGYSTVEWIAAQTWSNGKIGTWGPSALGKVQFQTAKFNPPHLTCICPLVAAPQFDYNEYYPNGSLRTEYVEQLDQLGFGLTTFLMAHPYKDNTWNYSEIINNYPDSIRVPCFMIGGWYDHNTQLMMDFFESLRSKSDIQVRSKHKLLMGPWVHGGHGAARVGTSAQGELSYPNASDRNDSMALQFFDFHLRNISNSWDVQSTYTLYQMGENQWKTYQSWPPAGINNLRLYLNRTGALSTSSNTNKNDSSTFLYNPYDPSPTIGGPTLRNDLVQGPYDQRALVESRQDVLIFSSEQLQEDLKLKGNVKVHLRVSSDRPDTDFDIRLTDVYPDGRSMLINDAVMRMRFRNGFTLAQSSMMVPGVVYDCEITLPASCITFLKGHRIRIIISSSNYPRFNRNMNNGNEMYPGKSTDSLLNPLQANNTVYFNADQVSYIDLPIEGYNNSIPTTGTWNELKIFPVPANDRIFIESVSSYTGEISIRDAYGRELIHQIEYDPAQGIDVSSLASGNYILYFKDQKSSAQIKFSICL